MLAALTYGHTGDGQNGEDELATLRAYLYGLEVGAVHYALFRHGGHYWCQLRMVEVVPALRRRGIARAMMLELRRRLPDVEASPVVLTPEGRDLRDALWGQLAQPQRANIT